MSKKDKITPQKAYDYMVNELKFSKEIAIGVLSQIKFESSFIPHSENLSSKERLGSFGLLQWNDSKENGLRGQNMKDWVDGKGTKNYDEGRWKWDWQRQLQYFKVEPKLLAVYDSETGEKSIRKSKITYYDDLEKQNFKTSIDSSNFITNHNIRPGSSEKEKGQYIDPYRIEALAKRSSYASSFAKEQNIKEFPSMWEANVHYWKSGGEVGGSFEWEGRRIRAWQEEKVAQNKAFAKVSLADNILGGINNNGKNK